MCGIAGLVSPQSPPPDKDLIARLLARLAHRGPDDQGLLRYDRRTVWSGRQWREGEAELVFLHRRLSIIDLSETGWQPMATPDGRYVIVYNGELYNFLELRAELEALGHRFRSRSDTEVLLQAYAQWGIDALNKFVGMFAFALLDKRERTVLLARDPFGIKPLYLATWRGGLAFASEIKVLLELPGMARRVNPHRLLHYLRYGVTDYGHDTFFLDIQQVSAAHYVKVPLDRPEIVPQVPYWRLVLGPPRDVSFEQAAETVRELFLRNVAMHVRSDVPIGAALSGGIDSSSIVAAMRRVGPDAELHTVSYIAEEAALNEAAWAGRVVQHASAVSHPVQVSGEELLADLERLVAVQDEPFGSSSIYAQFRVFQATREAGIKVMLDGQGADEILAGYPYYLSVRAAALFRHSHFLQGWRFLSRAAKRWPGGFYSLILASAGYLVPFSLQGPLRRLVGKDLIPSWLRKSWFLERGVVPRPIFTQSSGDMLREQLIHSLCFSSLPMLLRYEDRNSMAHSVESRVPFLTREFVEYLFSLPASYLIADNGTSKAVFRQAMRGLVPEEILNRQDKVGFATPEGLWFRGTQRKAAEMLVSDTVKLYPEVFDEENIRTLMREMLEGRRPVDATLWRIINVGVWGRVYSVRL